MHEIIKGMRVMDGEFIENRVNYKEIFNYTNKNVLITGGTGTMGAEFARAFAACGANVVIADIIENGSADVIADCEKNGGHAAFLKVNLLDLNEVLHMVSSAVEVLGNIDIFCNHAGINIRKPALECTPDDWDKVMTINLKSAFFAAQAVGKHMIDNKPGKIINTISDSCERGHKNLALYACSKGGMRMMTKVLAHEWAEYGRNVNGIAPGYGKTQLTERLLADEETYSRIISRIPMNRFADAQDVAALVLYLASPLASYVTGQTVFIEGGMHID